MVIILLMIIIIITILNILSNALWPIKWAI